MKGGGWMRDASAGLTQHGRHCRQELLLAARKERSQSLLLGPLLGRVTKLLSTRRRFQSLTWLIQDVSQAAAAKQSSLH